MLGLLLGCEPIAPGPQQDKLESMGDIVIQEVGGFTGGVGSPERRIASSALSKADQEKLDKLFAERKPANANFRYRLTRQGPNGSETVEVPPEAVPEALLNK